MVLNSNGNADFNLYDVLEIDVSMNPFRTSFERFSSEMNEF